MTLDEWIDELKHTPDCIELLSFLIELKDHRERAEKELEERALEIERDDWERESND